jgi:hypothetical protein
MKARERSYDAEGPGATLEEGSSPWGGVVMGLLLFLGLGLTLVLFQYLVGGVWYPAGFYVAVCVGWGAGWVKRFPRWSYPYGSLILVLASWWIALGSSLTWILVMDAFLPLVVVVVVSVILAPSIDPWRFLFRGIWQDWTRVSFALYGVLPLVLWAQFEEVAATYRLFFWVPIVLLVAGGALSYLRANRTGTRVLSLVAGLLLSWTLTTIGVSAYWDRRQAEWMPRPGQWTVQAQRMAVAGVILLVVLLSPVLLGTIRRVGAYMRKRRPLDPDDRPFE